MAAKLFVQLQGPRGGNYKNHRNQGTVVAFIDDDNDKRIIVDAFKGTGPKYERREQSLINICNGDGESSSEWTGTFDELCKKLKI